MVDLEDYQDNVAAGIVYFSGVRIFPDKEEFRGNIATILDRFQELITNCCIESRVLSALKDSIRIEWQDSHGPDHRYPDCRLYRRIDGGWGSGTTIERDGVSLLHSFDRYVEQKVLPKFSEQEGTSLKRIGLLLKGYTKLERVPDFF